MKPRRSAGGASCCAGCQPARLAGLPASQRRARPRSPVCRCPPGRIGSPAGPAIAGSAGRCRTDPAALPACRHRIPAASPRVGAGFQRALDGRFQLGHQPVDRAGMLRRMARCGNSSSTIWAGCPPPACSITARAPGRRARAGPGRRGRTRQPGPVIDFNAGEQLHRRLQGSSAPEGRNGGIRSRSPDRSCQEDAWPGRHRRGASARNSADR